MGCFSLPSFKKWLFLGVVHQNKGVTSKLPLNKRENDDSPQDSGGYPISKPTRRNPVLFVSKIAGAPRKGPHLSQWKKIQLDKSDDIFEKSSWYEFANHQFCRSILDRKITCHQYSRGCRHAVQDTFAWTWRWNKALAPAKGVGRKVGTLLVTSK